MTGWSSTKYVNTLRALSCPDYNPHFRQLLHIGFRIAAQMGEHFTDSLRAAEPVVSRRVTEDLLQHHLLPIFCIDHPLQWIMPWSKIERNRREKP